MKKLMILILLMCSFAHADLNLSVQGGVFTQPRWGDPYSTNITLTYSPPESSFEESLMYTNGANFQSLNLADLYKLNKYIVVGPVIGIQQFNTGNTITTTTTTNSKLPVCIAPNTVGGCNKYSDGQTPTPGFEQYPGNYTPHADYYSTTIFGTTDPMTTLGSIGGEVKLSIPIVEHLDVQLTLIGGTNNTSQAMFGAGVNF